MNNSGFFFEMKKQFARLSDNDFARGWQLKLSFLLLAALPVGLALAGDEAYTWKDAKGQVHFGNRPPEGQTATPIHVESSDRIYSWTDAEGKVQYGAHPPADVVAKELKEGDGSLSTIHAGKLRQGEKQLLREWRQR
jgi:hypothetical protein